VVVKVVKTGKEALIGHLRRFYREAMAMSRLNHPNIVRVHEFGVDVPTRTPFLIMEHVDGRTLRDLVDGDGPVPERRAARLLVQVARALLEAHNHGVLHRDLKPRNIMVQTLADGEELVKVLDFGLAKINEGDDPQPPLTMPGKTIGTPAYMSPEQVVSGEQDARTDLYGLGCVLHMVLTGSAPFVGNDLIDTMRMHLNREPPELPNPLADGLAPSDGLKILYKRLMAKRKTDRPSSAGDVVRDLMALAEGRLEIPKIQPAPTVVDALRTTEDLDEGDPDGFITTRPSLDGLDESSDALLTMPASDADMAMTELGKLDGVLAEALGSGIAPRNSSDDSLPQLSIEPTDPPSDHDAWTTVLPSNLEAHDAGSTGLTPNVDTPVSDALVHSAQTADPIHLVVPAQPRRMPILLPLGAGLLIAATIYVVASTKKADPPVIEEPPPIASVDPPPPIVAVTKPKAMLQSQPAGADVFFAGVRLGRTPLEVELPSTGAERSVSVELGGFEDARVSLHSDSPNVIFVPLTKKKLVEPPPASPPERSKTKAKKKKGTPAKKPEKESEVEVW
jgi:serine/threonine protein kinase